jgi:signal transduction histidine kinase
MRALFTGRARPAGAVLLLLLLVGLSRLMESVVLQNDQQNFDAVLDARCARYLATAEQEFAGVQRTTRRVATEIAGHPDVVRFLSGKDTGRAKVFETIGGVARDQDMGIELYDRQASLVAWEGRSGTVHRREVRIALDGQMTSYVNRTPIASQLFVAIPVRDRGAVIGAVIALRTVDVTYPLNNKYIRREGLTSELTRRLGVTVEFNFAPGAEPRKDGRYASAILYGIDSSRVGAISVLKPPRSALLDGVGAPFRTFESFLQLGLLGVLCTAAWRLVARTALPPLARLGMTAALISLARYGLLWIDVGTLMPGVGLFDPALFASQFAGGVARSVGDMTISVAALVGIVASGARLLSGPGAVTLTRAAYPRNRLLGVALAAIVILLLFWLHSGYGSVVRSVVFDSTLRFNDPRQIAPSVELAVMIADLLAAAACMMVLAAAGVRFLLKCLAGGGEARRREWVLAGFLMAVLGWVVGAVQESPLMPLQHRIVFAALCLLLARLIGGREEGQRVMDLRRGVLLLGVSALLYYPLVDLNAREKDRRRVESFADEVTRPVDGWMTFVVEDALHGFSGDETVDILLDNDREEIDRLPFQRWAQSLACREGYTSLFALTDSAGRELSRFAIGGQIQAVLRVDTAARIPAAESVAVRETGGGIYATRVYAGSTPIREFDGALVGYGRVLVAAGQQALFRGENPDLLRSPGPEDLRSFYRPVSVSEFRDGVVFTTNNPAIPVGYRLPDSARGALGRSGVKAVWLEEVIDGRPYETYCLRKPGSSATIAALGLEEPGPVWHLVGAVKLIAFCFVIVLLLAAVAVIARRLRGGAILETFRDRLLAAFLVTALVPLALMAIYGRYSARERLMSRIGGSLSQYTLNVAQNVPEDPDSLLRIPLTGAEDLATDVGIDFNLYIGSQLALTSRPELFETGILDRRMSGRAYSAVLLQGKRFYVETERIGAYQYAVGYRPIINEAGTIGSVVSVPTLFRQDELDAEVSGRNAFLLGVYLAVIAAMLAFATVFASRIAAPIHRLTEATRRVARGDLTVRLDDLRAEGEIGELIRSFEQMAGDLQQNRETLLRAERELAWKEMARQVAHEIKNPLTPMRLAVQHLRMVFREGAEGFAQVLEEVADTLLKQIDTLSRIATEFSHFARMPRAQLVPCDLNEVVRESVRLFDRVERVRFTLDAAPGLPAVLADRDELRRAFINILRNAIQAMNNAGAVTITTRSSGAMAEIVVHDTGPGIPAEIMERLFRPNFSTKTEGMGLGLVLVKKTVDDLGGSIRIESTAGEGTSVIILLPFPGPGQRNEGGG